MLWKLALCFGFLLMLSFKFENGETKTPPKKIIYYIQVQQNSDRIYIYGGNLTLTIDRNPWRLIVRDNFTSNIYIQEAADESNRLGFGYWKGRYYHIYEGYLTREGQITEWYHVTKATLHNVTKDESGALVAATIQVTSNHTSEKSPTMFITFANFYERQYDMVVKLKNAQKYNRVGWGYLTPDKDEAFYGFGARFDRINQRGHIVGTWAEEGYWGLQKNDLTGNYRIPRGELSTYAPMPLFMSSKGYGIRLNMYHRQELYVKNGRSLIPPIWMFGPWNKLGSEKADMGILTRAKDLLFNHDVPLSHSVNPVHYFPIGDGTEDKELIRLSKENGDLLDLGIKSTAYFNPMISQKWTNVYNYAATSGFFLKTAAGLPYNFTYNGTSEVYTVSQIDFTNPKAVEWYRFKEDNALEGSFRGWMCDTGEYTPPDSVSYDNHDGLYMHNMFPLLYQQTSYDHLVEDFQISPDYAPDYIFYVRSGYLGSERKTWAHITGKPTSDWNTTTGLPAQIIASLNAGISGIPYSGSDIGGHDGYNASLELWARWTQLGCFSGIMKEGGEGNRTYGATSIFATAMGARIWRKYAKLRTQLALYIYNTAHQSRSSGIPIMRHHILTHAYDKQAVLQDYQYMFGDSFLVAPIVKENVTKRSVYLPVIQDLGNNWIDFSSSTKYIEKDGSFRIGFDQYLSGGTTVEVDAPIDVIPTFVPAGNIIITSDPRVQTLSNATNPNVKSFNSMSHIRHVWVWPMKRADWIGSGQLYDGSSYTLYFGKMYNVSCEFLAYKTPRNFTHVVQMAGPWLPDPVGVKIGYTSTKLPNAGSVENLLSRVDDPTVAEWFFDKEVQTLWVKMTPEIYDFMVLYAV